MYVGHPGKQIVKTSFRYWIKSREQIDSNKWVNNRYLRGEVEAGWGGSENLNLQPTKKRIETSIKSY